MVRIGRCRSNPRGEYCHHALQLHTVLHQCSEHQLHYHPCSTLQYLVPKLPLHLNNNHHHQLLNHHPSPYLPVCHHPTHPSAIPSTHIPYLPVSCIPNSRTKLSFVLCDAIYCSITTDGYQKSIVRVGDGGRSPVGE